MKVSLQYIHNTLQDFCNKHGYLNGFYDKDITSSFDSIDYPCMWVQSDKMNLREGELSFLLNISIFDRLHDDSQKTKILSDTAIVLEDLITIFCDNIPEYSFNCSTQGTAESRISTPDKVCGWSINLAFKVGSSLNENIVPLLVLSKAQWDNYINVNETIVLNNYPDLDL